MMVAAHVNDSGGYAVNEARNEEPFPASAALREREREPSLTATFLTAAFRLSIHQEAGYTSVIPGDDVGLLCDAHKWL